VFVKFARRGAIAAAAWLPLFTIWVLSAMSFSHDRLAVVLLPSVITMGSGGLLGIAVWYTCRRWPWPAGFSIRFYVLQIVLALAYTIIWIAVVFGLESLRLGKWVPAFWTWATLARQCTVGIWLYGLYTGASYAIQTRGRLYEKEALAARAEASAAAAHLEALRARLNPHFLFNALHTLGALVKFHPELAEGAVERLGDMLRYTLREDGRDVVEFSEEYDFTRQYLAFEQLRYEDRLKIDLQVDPKSFEYELPPFSIQTLAENAVRHAISIRPEGGSIWISCSCLDGSLRVSVRDDGPGNAGDRGSSHQFGLRALRERLVAAFGPSGDLKVKAGSSGFEATFVVPRCSDSDEETSSRNAVRR
jgi:two-component system, LytTR family, sensor kinase